jgi:hypothetical protein
MPAVTSSSAIQRLHHDAAHDRLSVWFESGERYDYFEVSRAVYDAFVAADSKGRFFAERVRDRYRFARRD